MLIIGQFRNGKLKSNQWIYKKLSTIIYQFEFKLEMNSVVYKFNENFTWHQSVF